MTRRRTTSNGIEAWYAAPALHGEEDLRQSGSRGVRRGRGEPPGWGEAGRGVPLRELWWDPRWPPAELRTRVASARGEAEMSTAATVSGRPAFSAGDKVIIGANDAKVRAGSTGTVVKIAPETG